MATKSKSTTSRPAPRKPRSDGVEARERLLQVALRLFAEKGYAKTSTREIAQAAGVNVAAISYYFGDKEGLYRVVFNEPMGKPDDGVEHYDRRDLSLRQSLEGFLKRFLEPFKQGELVKHCTRLHFREMLEPTGMRDDHIDNFKTAHAALMRVLMRHLGLDKPDDDVRRLAFSIMGLGVQLFVTQDLVTAIQPRLIAAPPAIDVWGERLADYAEAMVASEAARRKTAAKTAKKKS